MRARADVRSPMVQSGKTYAEKILQLYGSAVIGYRQLAESAGTNANDSSVQGNDGLYTGVDLAHLAAPAKLGTMAPFFDGANDNVNLYSAAFAADTPTDMGTISGWARVANAGVWTDGVARCVVSIGNASHYFIARKGSTSNQLQAQFSLTLGNRQITFATTTTDWFHIALTLDSVANEYKFYVNGVQRGATQTGAGLLSTFINGRNYIGMRLSGGESWNGWICHEVQLNRAATAAEILQQYNLGV